MSRLNGDKSRFHRIRKANSLRREKKSRTARAIDCGDSLPRRTQNVQQRRRPRKKPGESINKPEENTPLKRGHAIATQSMQVRT